MRTTTVRLATVEDAEAIATLVHSAYRGDESRQGWTTEADLLGGQRTDEAMVRDLIAGPSTEVLVGHAPQAPEVLLACCLLEHRGESAYLGMFAVHPGLQGRGVGRAMLAAAEDHAAGDWGAARLELTVLNRRPELIAWYERRGFTLTGEEHEFPYGDERFGIPRHDDLVLLAMAKPIGRPENADVTASRRA
jgi:ribosomal protein S18 acetylase RimI-like enzyme